MGLGGPWYVLGQRKVVGVVCHEGRKDDEKDLEDRITHVVWVD